MKSKDVSLLVFHFQTSQEVTQPTFFPQLLILWNLLNIWVTF